MSDRNAKIAKCREQITPKYQCIYDKAMTGRSMKSAIHINCLLCVGCKRKEITDCQMVECSLFPYRPYQNPQYRVRRRTTALISDHYVRGKKVETAKKSLQPIERNILVNNPSLNRLRVKVIIEPETAK